MTIKDPGLFVFVESENNGVQITTPSNPQLTVGQRTDEVLNPSALYEYSLGIKDAINLDGGGSSCMLIGGKETIKLSDGRQRAVASTVMFK